MGFRDYLKAAFYEELTEIEKTAVAAATPGFFSRGLATLGQGRKALADTVKTTYEQGAGKLAIKPVAKGAPMPGKPGQQVLMKNIPKAPTKAGDLQTQGVWGGIKSVAKNKDLQAAAGTVAAPVAVGAGGAYALSGRDRRY